MSESIIRLIPSASTKSKARLLGLLREAVYLRGESYTIRVKVHNPMKAESPRAKSVAEIWFASRQPEYKSLDIPKLGPGEDWESEPTEFIALSEGYALVLLDNLRIMGNTETGQWVDSEGRAIQRFAIHGFHVETRRDYHTYFALVTSAVSLAILISEKVYSTLLLNPASQARDSPLLLAWYAVLVVLALFVLLTEGRDC